MYLRKNVVLYKRKCFSKQKFRDNFLIYLELEDEFKSHRRHTFILRKFYLPFFLIAFATQQQYNSIVTFHHNHLLIRLDFGLLEFSHVFLISFNHFFFYYSSFSLSFTQLMQYYFGFPRNTLKHEQVSNAPTNEC